MGWRSCTDESTDGRRATPCERAETGGCDDPRTAGRHPRAPGAARRRMGTQRTHRDARYPGRRWRARRSPARSNALALRSRLRPRLAPPEVVETYRDAPRLRRGAANAGGFGGPFRGPPFSLAAPDVHIARA